MRAVTLGLSISLIVGCAGITSPEVAGDAAKASISTPPENWRTDGASNADIALGWIATFDDEVLSYLVEEGVENNRDLRIAAANVERANGLARQAGAALLPQVNVLAGGSKSGVIEPPASRTGLELGAQVNWEIDVWGRIRAGKQGARLSAEAAAADFKYAQYSIAAAVARAYFLSIEAGMQEDVARRTVDALQETARIVRVQYENGLASSQDLALTLSDFAAARDRLTAAAGGKRDAIRALEVLLGRYPAVELALREDLPNAPPAPAAGTPSSLLERRPDIIAAERNVAASFNALESARAARLPTISLTSNIGGASERLTNLLDPANVAWTVAGNLAAPIFDGGARQAQVKISRAEQRQAIAAYGQTALEAFSEVERNLDQGVILEKRAAALTEAAIQANEAFRIARLRYNEGETDLIDVLTIQQRAFNADSNLVSIERQLLEQRVNLHLALGGTW